MSAFAHEDRQGKIDFVSDRDIVFESDRDQDGVGDLVFRTGGVERARIDFSGAGTGWAKVLGGALPPVGTPLDHSLKDLRRRALKGWSALPTLNASLATTALGVANAASSIASSALVYPWDTSAFTYDGLVPGYDVGNKDTYAGAGASNSVYSANTSPPPWAVEFDFVTSDGKFEIKMLGKGVGAALRVLVNGSFLTTEATFSPPSDGNNYYGLVTLAAGAGTYRIRIEFEGLARFRGINCIQTNAVVAAPKRSQRWIVMGDSFAEPTLKGAATTLTALTNANDATVTVSSTTGFPASGQFVLGSSIVTYTGTTATTFTGCTGTPAAANSSAVVQYFHTADGWVQKLGYLLGVDAWSCGKGGTGYLNPGSFVTFRSRIADATGNSPDVIVWAGGINDYVGYTSAAIQAEALLCFQAAQAALPGVQQIVLSPFFPHGSQSFGNNLLATADALKTAAGQVTNTVFVDLLRMPLPPNGTYGGPTPAATTLSAQAASGQATVQIVANIPLFTVFQVGTGSDAEIRNSQGSSGTGPYTISFGGAGGGNLVNTHPSGETVQAVGPAYITGTGNVGALAANGTADVFTGADGTHPTSSGHSNIARVVAELVAAQLSA